MLAVLGVALVAFAPANRDDAVGDRASIEWSAPPECPGGAVVDEFAEQLLLAIDGRVTASARVSKLHGRYELVLTVGASTMEVSAPECESLARAAALLVAVAADPPTVINEPLEPPVIVPPPPSTPTRPPPMNVSVQPPGPPPPPRVDDPTRRSRLPLSGRVGLLGIVGVAELPTLDAGLGAVAAVERGRIGGELIASWLAPRSVPFEGQAGGEAVLSALNVSVRACGILGRARLRAALCGGPELGAVLGSARGVSGAQRSADLWLAVIAAPGLQWWVLPRVGIHAGGELVLALRRPQFALRAAPDDAVAVRQGGFRLAVGVSLRLGRVARR